MRLWIQRRHPEYPFHGWIVRIYFKHLQVFGHVRTIRECEFVGHWGVETILEVCFKTHWRTDILNISCEIGPLWMPTSVPVMAWCRQATNHYFSQCWPRSISSNDFTGLQYVIQCALCEASKQITTNRNQVIFAAKFLVCEIIRFLFDRIVNWEWIGMTIRHLPSIIFW